MPNLNSISSAGSKIRLKEIFFDDFLVDGGGGVPQGWTINNPSYVQSIQTINSEFILSCYNGGYGGISKFVLLGYHNYLAELKYKKDNGAGGHASMVMGGNNVLFYDISDYNSNYNIKKLVSSPDATPNASARILIRTYSGYTYRFDYIRIYEILGL